VKRILIPTDLKVESLITLKKAIDSIEDSNNEIILLYAEHLPDSITELLFYSPNNKRKKMIPTIFYEAITILKNRYEKKIRNIAIEFFHGNGSNALRNFATGHRVDITFIPSNYIFKPLKNGFDPIPLIRKSKLIYQEITWERNDNYFDSQDLSLLLY